MYREDCSDGNKITKIVNSTLFNPKVVAKFMATEHRYLQQEFFKMCIHFIAILAKNYRKGLYDGRNEWAAQMSAKMFDAVKDDYYFTDEMFQEEMGNGKWGSGAE